MLLFLVVLLLLTIRLIRLGFVLFLLVVLVQRILVLPTGLRRQILLMFLRCFLLRLMTQR